jgi:putative transposase
MEIPADVRVAIVPVWFNRAKHQRLHEACHENAGLWNELVEWVRAEWKNGHHKVSKRDILNHADSLNKSIPLHSHTIQAVAKDLHEAIRTSRTNRKNGMKVRAPWRHKNYRPLSFSHNFGWRVTPEGDLALSFGRGQERVIVPMPEVVDARTGLPVPHKLWGEIQLCWDQDAREWSFHIPYTTDMVMGLPQAEPDEDGTYPEDTVTVAVDPGVIHPMTLTVHNKDTSQVDALVVSGREIRSQKRLRNKHLGSLARAISRTTKGSRKHKKLTRKRKKVKAKTKRQMVNANHHVAKKAADWTREQAVDTATGEVRPVRVVIGDLAGFEKSTKKQRRARRQQRQQFSQVERGTQEKYLGEKLGMELEKIPEHHTSQTCPRCGTRKKQTSRNFTCGNCHIEGLHRDVVGAGNIGSRADNGGTQVSASTPIVPWIDNNTTVVVTYQRVQHVWTDVQRALHGHHQALRGRSGVRVEKPAVAAQNRARHTITGMSVAEGQQHPVAQQQSQPVSNLSGCETEDGSTVLTATSVA